METKESPAQIGHGASILDDLKSLIDSLPTAVRAETIASLQGVFAGLTYDPVDQSVSPA